MGSYIPSTVEERQEMMERLGINDITELYQSVPKSMLLSRLDIPEGKSELEVKTAIEQIARKNKVFKSIFRGAGAYNHYIPAIEKSVTSKEEFLTAYTPYQAEISQGVLQSIFEYQTGICEITGMDVSNASVYDGASAAAESVAMCTDRKRKKAIISATVNPRTVETVKTYCFASNTEIIVAPQRDGKTDLGALAELVDDETACVIIASPNYLGLIEDADEIASVVHERGAKLVMSVNPISLGLLKSPREYGADVAVGEGQPLGLPLSFGGPYLGFMAATGEMMRKLPGRIVGETVDVDGKRAFVLTLQAREQHIRREKASSNICSNEALCAMTASVYLAAMGEKGLREAASLSFNKAHYLKDELLKIKGFSLLYNGEFFNEFVTKTPINSAELSKTLIKYDILSGLPLEEDTMLWCATEMNSKSQIDELVAAIKEVCA